MRTCNRLLVLVLLVPAGCSNREGDELEGVWVTKKPPAAPTDRVIVRKLGKELVGPMAGDGQFYALFARREGRDLAFASGFRTDPKKGPRAIVVDVIGGGFHGAGASYPGTYALQGDVLTLSYHDQE